jgi:mRNA interferase RelE/StbE
MSWVCSLTRTATRELARLPRNVQRRIAAAIDAMEADPFQGDVRPLRGQWQGYYRKRVGGYRIIFDADTGNHQVTILAIRSRSNQTYR